MKKITGAVCIEGEKTVRCNYSTDYHDGNLLEYENGIRKTRTFKAMSGGKAGVLSSRVAPDEYYSAQYEFEARTSFPAVLWVFEHGRRWSSPFEWRIDGAAWQYVSTELPMENITRFEEDASPLFAWGRLGRVDVDKGKHLLDVRVKEAKRNGHYLLAQDCFVLIPQSARDAAAEEYPYAPNNLSVIRQRKDFVVIEGGKPATSEFIVDEGEARRSAGYKAVLASRRHGELHDNSASLLLTRKGPEKEYSAAYEFRTEGDRRGVLWVCERKRQESSPFQWRVDRRKWHPVSTAVLAHEPRNIDEGPAFTWSRLGTVALTGKHHVLEIKVTEPCAGGAYFLNQDVFVVVPDGADGEYNEHYPFDSFWAERPTVRSVFLWDDKPKASSVNDGFRPWLEPYLVKTEKAVGAVIVCPGGAYRFRSPREGSPVAKAFNARGFHAFVLQYRVLPHARTESHLDAQRAVRIIRARAGEWNVKPDRIALCGFSAGGNLAGSVGLAYDNGIPGDPDPVERASCRPDGLIICYAPVYGIFDTDDNVIPDDFPPTFIWHTVTDATVSVTSAIRLMGCLQKKGIPFESHIFPEGAHGLDLAEKDPYVGRWFDMACMFLDKYGWRE